MRSEPQYYGRKTGRPTKVARSFYTLIRDAAPELARLQRQRDRLEGLILRVTRILTSPKIGWTHRPGCGDGCLCASCTAYRVLMEAADET
jgi:hypothetical protein